MSLHLEPITRKPNAFISVSLTASEDTPEAREAVDACMQPFFADTGWHPIHTFSIAGALLYSRYNLPTRLMMRAKMRRGGHPSDGGRDREYTDWDQVDRVGRDAASLVVPSLAAKPVA